MIACWCNRGAGRPQPSYRGVRRVWHRQVNLQSPCSPLTQYPAAGLAMTTLIYSDEDGCIELSKLSKYLAKDCEEPTVPRVQVSILTAPTSWVGLKDHHGCVTFDICASKKPCPSNTATTVPLPPCQRAKHRMRVFDKAMTSFLDCLPATVRSLGGSGTLEYRPWYRAGTVWQSGDGYGTWKVKLSDGSIQSGPSGEVKAGDDSVNHLHAKVELSYDFTYPAEREDAAAAATAQAAAHPDSCSSPSGTLDSNRSAASPSGPQQRRDC